MRKNTEARITIARAGVVQQNEQNRCGVADEERDEQHTAVPEAPRDAGPEPRAEERADRPDREREADQHRAQPDIADGEDHQSDEEELEEQVEGRGLREQGSQVLVAYDDAETIGDLAPDGAALSRALDALVDVDPADGERGDEIARGVEQHGDRRRDRLHEQAPEALAADLGRGLRRCQLAVGIEQGAPA